MTKQSLEQIYYINRDLKTDCITMAKLEDCEVEWNANI